MIDSPHELEGVSLAGGYGLEQCLGMEGDAAFFQTRTGAERRPALLKLTPDDGAAGEEQLALWRETAALSHPNLLALLDSGRAEQGGEPFVYAVFEYPDDKLAVALAAGPLDDGDTREVLEAALGALRYLHARDLVHTAIDADHIVAVGDRIKLASDTLRHAGEGGATPAGDVRALGALLYELRTGRRIEPDVPLDLAGVSEPLCGIIEHAVEPDAGRRWTLAEIEAALHAPAPRAEEPALAVETPAPPPAATAEPAKTEHATGAPALALPKRSPALPLLLAAAGAVVVAIVLAVTGRSVPEPPTADVTAAPATPVSNPNPPVAPPAAPPAGVASAPSHATPAEGVAHRAETRFRDSWRVIAYTYNRREQAEHKAQTINRIKPGFEAAVFAPKGANQPPYFVALGGRMSREEAAALQRKARAGGLPRDTFVRNY